MTSRTLLVFIALLASTSAHADFIETFDSGSAGFTANDPYWLNNNLYNGLVIQSTAVTGYFGTAITSDVSGNGYFLFEGTGSYTDDSNVIPAGHGDFYVSPEFAVAPDADYDVSFYLTNAGSLNVASIDAQIGDQTFGPVSATGQFDDGNPADQWQQFSFVWNSGSNSTATLTLTDLTGTDTGDDFAIDDIAVVGTPEPATGLFMAGGVLIVISARRKPCLGR